MHALQFLANRIVAAGKDVNWQIVLHLANLSRIGQPWECVQKRLHRIGLKRREAQRIVDKSIDFCVVTAKPIKWGASWFKRSVHQLHRICARRNRLSKASQAIKCARSAERQAVDGMTVVEHKLLCGERAHAVSQQDVWPASMLVLCDDS